jgi:hypothetical protein
MSFSKGSVADSFVIMTYALAISIIILLSWTILDNFSSEAAATGLIDVTYLHTGETALETFNYSFVFIVIGLILISFYGVLMINSNPAIFIISLMLLAIAIIVSVPISNAYYYLSINSDIASATNQFDVMSTMMYNLPEIIGVGFLLIIIIGLYAKYNRGGAV